MFGFEDLPDEVIINITSYLAPKDEATVNILSKRFSHLKPQNYQFLFKDAISYNDISNIIFKYIKEYEIFEYFLNNKISDDYVNSLYVDACDKGDAYIVVELLQDKRVDPCYKDNIGLINACSNGHLEVVDVLLNDPRVDPSYNKNSPIYYASINGHTDVVDRLLEDDRVDPSDQNNSALMRAIYYNYIGVVKRLLKDHRVNVIDQNGYAMINAIFTGNLDIVELLSIYMGNYIVKHRHFYLNYYKDVDPEIYEFILYFQSDN